MDDLLKSVKILLSISMQQLSDEEIVRTDQTADEIWDTIQLLIEEKDLKGIEVITASLAVLHQIIEFVLEMTENEE